MKKALLIIAALAMVSCATTQDNSAYLIEYPKHDPDADCYVTLSSGKKIYIEDGVCHEFHLMADVNGNERHEDRN